jgi:hypothetical protein
VRAGGLFVAICALCAHPAGAGDPVALPKDLAGYRSWMSPTAEPVAVPARLWNLCAIPGADHRAEAAKEHGPHAARLVRVYANESAATELPHKDHRFPVGSVIAKDKLGAMSDDLPLGVAFMLKSNDPRFRDSGGWEFRFYPQSGDAEATHQACAACHRGAKRGNYVFGDERAR